MNDCLVSIIVPVFNTEKYLRRCIDSILTQTLTDFELLLVDNGSTDSSSLIRLLDFISLVDTSKYTRQALTVFDNVYLSWCCPY